MLNYICCKEEQHLAPFYSIVWLEPGSWNQVELEKPEDDPLSSTLNISFPHVLSRHSSVKGQDMTVSVQLKFQF